MLPSQAREAFGHDGGPRTRGKLKYALLGTAVALYLNRRLRSQVIHDLQQTIALKYSSTAVALYLQSTAQDTGGWIRRLSMVA